MSGLETTGWVPKTVTEIVAEIETDLRAALGDDLDTSAESVIGQIIAIQATREAELWELVGAVYNARVPSGASGAALEALAALCPGIDRAAATKGTATLSVTLSAGVTLPAGSVASVTGEPSNRWVTTESVTNGTGSPATVSVAAEAETAGRLVANAGTITVIATPVTGWTAVTNAADATPGTEVETDAALRVRRERTLQRAGSSPLDAIAAEVAEVAGVTQCVAWENATDHTDSAGRPPHSVEVMVLGGDDEDVARAIWSAKAAGIETYGTETPVTFTDDRGVSRTVRFSRPTDLDVYATVIVVVDPATFEGATAVKEALVAAMENLRAGEVARNSAMVAALLDVVGVRDAVVYTGDSSSLTLQTRDNLAPGERERCAFDTSRVEVTVSS